MLERYGEGVRHVVLVMQTDADWDLYQRILPLYFPRYVSAGLANRASLGHGGRFMSGGWMDGVTRTVQKRTGRAGGAHQTAGRYWYVRDRASPPPLLGEVACSLDAVAGGLTLSVDRQRTGRDGGGGAQGAHQCDAVWHRSLAGPHLPSQRVYVRSAAGGFGCACGWMGGAAADLRCLGGS